MSNIPKIAFRSNLSFVDGFEVIDLDVLMHERTKELDHSPFKVHRLDFFSIVYIEKGEVSHSVDFKTYHLSAGDYLIIAKGQVHSFDEHSHYHGKMLIFTDTFLYTHFTRDSLSKINILFNYFAVTPKYNVSKNQRSLVQSIAKEFNSYSELTSSNIIGALLTIFFLEIQETQPTNGHPHFDRSNELFLEFKSMVEQSFTTTRDAKHYANELGISYKHLNEVSKTIVGSTAKAFIDSFVVLEAKRMLITTSLSSKEISFDCGFDEPTNFIKFFKKHTGLTPEKFRKK